MRNLPQFARRLFPRDRARRGAIVRLHFPSLGDPAMNTRMLRLCAIALLALPAAAFAASPLILNCQTITQPGSYVVARNLSSTGDFIVVASSFVTLDLAGFTISGNGSASSVGIHEAPGTAFPGLRGVVIRNGNVTNFGVGIEFFVSDGVTV